MQLPWCQIARLFLSVNNSKYFELPVNRNLQTILWPLESARWYPGYALVILDLTWEYLQRIYCEKDKRNAVKQGKLLQIPRLYSLADEAMQTKFI